MEPTWAGAIIGGTGLCDPELLEQVEKRLVTTDYGEALVYQGWLEGIPVVFLPRHGAGHSLPPHRINYRANIAALKQLGITRVLASAAVGSLLQELKPGVLALAGQFLDFTRLRTQTFFEGQGGRVVHTDVTEPYCPQMRKQLRGADRQGQLFSRDVTYVCTEGPRFETPAEIDMFARLGGEVVGMTGVPEVVLAREARMHYAAVTMVTNYAAGHAGTPLSHQEVVDMMGANAQRIRQLFARALAVEAEPSSCSCTELGHW